MGPKNGGVGGFDISIAPFLSCGEKWGDRINPWLVLTGTMEWIMTFHILGIATPTDELTFPRGVGIPPTR